MNYEVKGVKTFRGMEGYGFNASLYRDGKKVALVIDEGNGGDYNFEWFDFKLPRVEATINGLDGELKVKVTPEESIFLQYVKENTDASDYEGADTVVARLVDKFEENKKLKQYCKKKTLFRLKSDPDDGSWRTCGGTTEKTREFITAKYGDQVAEIANDRFI